MGLPITIHAVLPTDAPAFGAVAQVATAIGGACVYPPVLAHRNRFGLIQPRAFIGLEQLVDGGTENPKRFLSESMDSTVSPLGAEIMPSVGSPIYVAEAKT